MSVEIDAAAIVADFDDDLGALVVGVQVNGAARRLTSAHTLLGRLDAVIGGVADQVSERLGEGVEYGFIEVGVFAGDFQGDVFAAELGDVANYARKAAEKLLDGNHANLEDAFVKFVENAGLKRKRFGKFVANRIAMVFEVKFGESAMEHGFANDELAYEVHDGIDARGVHAKRAFGDGVDRGRGSSGGRAPRSGLQRFRDGSDLGRLSFEHLAEKFVLGRIGLSGDFDAHSGNYGWD